MAENEDKSEVLKVESSLKQINEDLERIHISLGSNKSITKNEEESVAPKVETLTEQIREDPEGTRISSGDKVVYKVYKVVYGDPRAGIPRILQPCHVTKEYLRGEETSGSPCKEGQEGDKFTKTFTQQWIDVVPHSFKGRCFKSVSIITKRTCSKHNSHMYIF